ncbi:MAG: DUF2934 domain-containing protein [Sideroxydans sp.]|nr:DUF2934 domain-containing protein [Sideroxydans sp.]MDD5470432.1 DUF2934 domain-containing protein [Sideroxydans sp.]
MTKSKKTATSAKAAPGLAEGGAGLPHPVTPEQRHHYVEVAAYYIAERRGFDTGSCDDDWAQAEIEIDRLLAEGRLNH